MWHLLLVFCFFVSRLCNNLNPLSLFDNHATYLLLLLLLVPFRPCLLVFVLPGCFALLCFDVLLFENVLQNVSRLHTSGLIYEKVVLRETVVDTLTPSLPHCPTLVVALVRPKDGNDCPRGNRAHCVLPGVRKNTQGPSVGRSASVLFYFLFVSFVCFRKICDIFYLLQMCIPRFPS